MSNSNRSHRVGTTGNLQHSMRANYGEHGVDNYYKKVGATYRNPHFPGVRACMFTWLDRWWAHEQDLVGSRLPLIFDMACGIGEVTVAAYEWWKHGPSRPQANRKGHAYRQFRSGDGSISQAPQADSTDPKNGTAGSAALQVPRGLSIMAADPYTVEAYVERTTLPCEPLSFREISEGALPSPTSLGLTTTGQTTDGEPDQLTPSAREVDDAATPKEMDMAVCSFALHLIEFPSELFALLWELSTKARWLVVLAPHKKPEIKDGWGWVKWDCERWAECDMSDRGGENVQERVHCRVYRSINVAPP
ncbi:hypothetical protein F5I97DRAFT_1811310 [Phlebopus sp. FC_14]|nr:hypothetical protein F5I97DRAFT_1811310 [Phlebopus sp. FC_14]